MPLPLGYLLTWTTYGTWLPGDDRGWVDDRHGAWHVPYREAAPKLERDAKNRQSESAVRLSHAMRKAVEAALAKACSERSWQLHAANARLNHLHVVVAAGDIEPGKGLGFLKKECSKALSSVNGRRSRWWTNGGSKRYLNESKSLTAAIRYVENQDTAWMKEP